MADITFIGMGEAGSAFVAGWRSGGQQHAIRAYDIKSDRPETASEISARYETLGIEGCMSSAAAVGDAGLVLCTVTADQAVAAAEAAAPHVKSGAFWCDLNSCAPSSKRQAAQIIEAAGGRYVDVAVMAPVDPKLNMTPLLISGPHAEAVAPLLASLPMAARIVAGDVGAASSIKMIRSVMVKGLEALTAECILAACAAGVEEDVLNSLQGSHPDINWRQKSAYNFERMLAHGARRAAEMEEVAKTLRDMGLPDDMAAATTIWQNRIAATRLPAPKETETEQQGMLTARTILSALRSR